MLPNLIQKQQMNGGPEAGERTGCCPHTRICSAMRQRISRNQRDEMNAEIRGVLASASRQRGTVRVYLHSWVHVWPVHVLISLVVCRNERGA